eukprot:6014597-Amphidinium_carterae.1
MKMRSKSQKHSLHIAMKWAYRSDNTVPQGCVGSSSCSALHILLCARIFPQLTCSTPCFASIRGRGYAWHRCRVECVDETIRGWELLEKSGLAGL